MASYHCCTHHFTISSYSISINNNLSKAMFSISLPDGLCLADAMTYVPCVITG